MSSPNRSKRVYGWEDGWASWNTPSLKLKDCRQLVHAALEAYGLPPIPVRSHPGKDMAFYLASDEHPLISFPRDMQNAAIALHEAAHHICDSYFGRETQEHCPEWLGIYLWLLAKAKVAPRVALEASVKAAGLKWVRNVTPSALKRKGLYKNA